MMTSPAPTVRPSRKRTADRLLQAASYPLILGVVGSAPVWILLHRPHLAILIAAVCVVPALVLMAAAAAIAARRHAINLAPVRVMLLTAACGVSWFILPAGDGWLRGVLVIVPVWALIRGCRSWARNNRRRATYHRCCQALAQVFGQVEQVSAGLAGVINRDRVAAPHLGVAPGAAWSLQVTKWNGVIPRTIVISLPAHDNIGDPDFLAQIRDALRRRVGLPYVKLSADALRDTITVTVLREADKDAPVTDPKTIAIDRAKTAASHVLKGVTISVLEWDPASAPADAPPSWPLKKIRIGYDQTPRVTPPAARENFRVHLGLQLFGDESALRAQWFLGQDYAVFTRRGQFPPLILCRPQDEAAALNPGKTIVQYAWDEDNSPVGYLMSHTDNPHVLITGGTGSGKSVCLRCIMIRAARLGIDVRGCDPKRVEMRGLRGWPNVTRIATRVPDMIRLIDDLYDEMHRRYEDLETGAAHASDFQRILLVIDEFLMFSMLINDYWAEQKMLEGDRGTKEHPVMRKLRGLIVMARGALITIAIATQRGDAVIFPEGVRDSLGERIALGGQSKESAFMMFGDASIGRDLPPGSQGVGHSRRALPNRIKVEFLPDPADWDNAKEPLTGEERQLLLDMLPSGASWDGPLGYGAPDPGFEDTAGTEEVISADAATRLLFFARAALRTREAHLTGAPDGGPPADSPAAAFYGWAVGARGQLEASGTWIGTVADTREGRRVYLHPDRAVDVARRLAAPLGVEFAYTRAQLDSELHASGLLRTESEGGKQRWTVRRQLPGNDLPGDDRQRVWDLPADQVLGDLPDAEEEPPRTPARRRSRRPEPGAEAPASPPGAEAPASPTFAGPEVPPWELCAGSRIILPGGQVVTVDDIGGTTASGLEARISVSYRADDGTPGELHLLPSQFVRLAERSEGNGS
jgi:hypothetical protein